MICGASVDVGCELSNLIRFNTGAPRPPLRAHI